ncbi:hypothetical protein GCM10017771_21100 [Streptomyces capitiformicae]|uniref:Uncharacterized protein n=1 Tax=Streptomyces capitiformicae TaxID=2014920 RepID=A0A919GK79_9ACTN|nr:hypothetical protein GCM10017771_21100 [Streptomyces capitiformicae]
MPQIVAISRPGEGDQFLYYAGPAEVSDAANQYRGSVKEAPIAGAGRKAGCIMPGSRNRPVHIAFQGSLRRRAGSNPRRAARDGVAAIRACVEDAQSRRRDIPWPRNGGHTTRDPMGA